MRVVVWTLAAVYLSYWFAYAIPPIGRVVSRFGDASYGVYIWAFPIQQTLVQEIPSLEPWGIIALATPIVLALAYASWHFVERPSLRHKPRRPVTASAPPPAA